MLLEFNLTAVLSSTKPWSKPLDLVVASELFVLCEPVVAVHHRHTVHAASPEDFLAMVEGYARAHGLAYDSADALQWARQHGNNSGRVAWQYIIELAGRAGKSLK